MLQEELSFLATARPRINYNWISQAIQWYTMAGYSYIEVPWLVSEDAINKTLPPGATSLQCSLGSLVGSAEQSFLEIFASLDPKKKYVAASPCFRDEAVDQLHQKSFFKVELFSTAPEDWHQMLADAHDFLASIDCKTEAVKTDSGIDLTLNNIEVGSYGPRSYGEIKWACGTGLAEPRTSTALWSGNGRIGSGPALTAQPTEDGK